MSEPAEYLVHIEVNWPPDGDTERRDELIAAERARGQELVEAGVIGRLWRVPGRWANWGVWRATSPAELHEALASLPFFPWLDIEVIPLAHHLNDPG
ncbi:MAG: muconolactone Delta-isomerase family protein [bacterium]|nr:muconolactone Delta-isomerase family protein [bacterium]MDE0668319.1 muconolactone Delta-isomerase family protein [bacterium]